MPVRDFKYYQNLTAVMLILFAFIFTFVFLNSFEKENIVNYPIEDIFQISKLQRAFVGFAYITPPVSGSYVARNISSISVSGNNIINISLVVFSRSNETIIAIDEKLPIGFSQSDIIFVGEGGSINDTPGGNDNYQHIKWINYSNSSAVPNMTFHYSLRIPPSLPLGEYFFTGEFQFENSPNISIYGYNSITIYNSPPTVTLNSPMNAATYYNIQTVTFNYTPSDIEQSSLICNLLIDNVIRNITNATTNMPKIIVINTISYGRHYWNVSCNDSIQTNYSSTRYFDILDTQQPNLTVNSPVNGTTYNSSVLIPLLYTVSDSGVGVDKCWYNLNGVIYQLPSCANLTNMSGVVIGLNNLSVFVNDSSGNIRASILVQFTRNVSNSAPMINLNYPVANTQINNVQTVNFNYTAIDTQQNILYCDLYLDSVLRNSTIALNNVPNIIQINNIAYSSHSWYVRCNDGFLYNNSESELFSINDTIAPSITLYTPSMNTQYNNTPVIIFDYSVTDGQQPNITCSLFLDGPNVVNVHGFTNYGDRYNIPLFVGYGNHNWSVGCNDGYNNAYSATRFFSVRDTQAPSLTLLSPGNTVYNATEDISLIYSVSDNVNVNICWYKVNTGSAIILSGCENISNIPETVAISSYNLTIYVNDTSNNVNSTSVSFIRNISVPPNVPPVITLEEPINNDYFADYKTIIFKFLVNDTDFPISCDLNIDNNTNHIILGVGEIGVFYSVNYSLDYGNHNWNINCSDGQYMTRSETRNFTIYDNTLPSLNIYSPISYPYVYGGDEIPLVYTVSDNLAIDTCWYIINTGARILIPNCQNLTNISDVREGINLFYFAVNDTSSNTLSRVYNISKDSFRPFANYDYARQTHSKAFVNGANVTVYIPILFANMNNTRIANITFEVPSSWTGILSYELSDGISNITVIPNGTNITYEFNGALNYSLKLVIPSPSYNLLSEFGNETNYNKNFSIVSSNHFVNVSANISINSSYNNYVLYWFNGTNYVIRTEQYALRILPTDGVALFEGFNTSDQYFYLIGSQSCNLYWECSPWGTCQDGVRFRTVSCGCSNRACLPVQGTDCDGTTQTTLGCGTGSTGSGGSGSASSGGSSSSGGGYTSSISSSSSSSSSTGVPQINITPPPPPPRFESVDGNVTGDINPINPIDTQIPGHMTIKEIITVNWKWIMGVILFIGIITTLSIYILRKRKIKSDISETENDLLKLETGDQKKKQQSPQLLNEKKEEEKTSVVDSKKLEQLKLFIKESYNRGRSSDEIIKSLEDVGWSKEAINKYMSEINKK